MTDQQFQPGQTNPPVQGGGVFGGNPNVVLDPTSFGPMEQPVQEQTFTDTTPSQDFSLPTQEVQPVTDQVVYDEGITTSPFEGYTLPQAEESMPAVAEVPAIEPVIEAPVAEPITEVPVIEPVIEAPVAEPITEVPAIEPVIEAPVAEPITEMPVVEPVSEPVIEEEISIPTAQVPVAEKSDIQQKFSKLSETIADVCETLSLDTGDFFETIGANTDSFSVLYQFGQNEQQDILVKRIETQKEDDETSYNEMKLALNPETDLLEVFLDDVLLFEESNLLEDNKKKSQVMEKINKFIFLTESKAKDLEREVRAKQEEEQERKRLQDIFRNF